MIKKVTTAHVDIWGQTVGAVSWQEEAGYAVFEFEPKFLRQGIDLSPLMMKSNVDNVYSFPELDYKTYYGLPGLLADSLPDKFGNNIINAWLARQGRNSDDFSPIERLCYIGKRAMGALEFRPSTTNYYNDATPVEISELILLADEITKQKSKLTSKLNNANNQAMKDILKVGTSAGGARSKAIIAINNQGDILSGQTDIPQDFEHWIIKFDGTTDLELGTTQNYGKIEYAYYLMAKHAKIDMSQCKLLKENGRAHFMTKRFDRNHNEKIHMQTLCGIAHFDFNKSGSYGYEQAFAVMLKLRLDINQITQQYRRMVFNVLAVNMDDHTKNISFLLRKDGNWQLSPAYDVTYSHNPAGKWTNKHQMTINGKRENFTLEDLIKPAELIGIKNPKEIIEEVSESIALWDNFAEQADLNERIIANISKAHKTHSIDI